jgi:hypothetical protein
MNMWTFYAQTRCIYHNFKLYVLKRCDFQELVQVELLIVYYIIIEGKQCNTLLYISSSVLSSVFVPSVC